jgi:uncharacterized membrane protein
MAHGPLRVARAIAAVAVTTLALDLTWLGFVAKPVYDALGPLKREPPFLPAVALFYAMYVLVTFAYAVRPATTYGQAARKGASLGFVAYATYELTNWAVLQGWPARLVPIDLAWGVVLTTVAAVAGRAALGGREEEAR